MRPDLPALTGLRFLAAVHVVIGHIAVVFLPQTGWVHEIASTGYIGVTLFFLLSGFILAYNYNDQGRLRGTQRNFMVARLARIYPLYLFALLLALPSFFLAVKGHRLSLFQGAEAALLTPLMLQSWHPESAVALAWNMPGWSLSTEIFFYVAFPFLLPLFAKLSTRRLAITALAIWLLAILPAVYQASVLPTTNWQEFAIHFPLLRLSEFSLGIVTGLAFSRGWRISGHWSPWLFLLIGALLVALHPEVPKPVISNGLLAPIFALLVIALAEGRGWFARMLATPTARLLGEASYGVYLLHIPLYTWFVFALSAVLPRLVGTLGAFILFSVVLIGVSIAAYRWIEVPCRKWIRQKFAPNSRSVSQHPVG